MKDITVTIEDEDQKAIITIKETENDQVNVNAEFVPPIDNTKDTVPPVVGVTMNFLRAIKG